AERVKFRVRPATHNVNREREADRREQMPMPSGAGKGECIHGEDALSPDDQPESDRSHRQVEKADEADGFGFVGLVNAHRPKVAKGASNGQPGSKSGGGRINMKGACARGVAMKPRGD